MHVIIIGSGEDAAVIGPFPGQREAVDYGNKYFGSDIDWWYMPVETPEYA